MKLGLVKNDLVEIPVRKFICKATAAIRVWTTFGHGRTQRMVNSVFQPHMGVVQNGFKLHGNSFLSTALTVILEETDMKRVTVKPVKELRPEVVESGFPVLDTDGRTGATGSARHQKELITTIQQYSFKVLYIGSSAADTALENDGIFDEPFEAHDHFQCKAHRADLAFKDVFKEFLAAKAIIDPFVNMPTFLTGKKQQQVDTLKETCEQERPPFKYPMAVRNTRFISHVIVLGRMLDCFKRELFPKNSTGDDAEKYKMLKEAIVENSLDTQAQLLYSAIVKIIQIIPLLGTDIN